MAPVKLTTFIHPDKAYRLQYPASWEHVSKGDARSCGFGPRERDDVGLWISIQPMSLDTDRLIEEMPKLFRQTLDKADADNLRKDETLRHYGLKADIKKEGEAGHYWLLEGAFGATTMIGVSSTP